AALPRAYGNESPHAQMAAIAMEKKDRARAITELTALVANDFDNVDAARQLVTLLRQTNVDDTARLRPVYERIGALDPFDADAHTNLGRLPLQRNEAHTAAREFRTVIALGPVDRAAAYTDLAESYFNGAKRAEAKKQTLAAPEEQALSRRVKTASAIRVEDPILLTRGDPRLFENPWIYFVEPSSMRLQENEIPLLREFLLRGGFAMMDDFHGPYEWDAFAR